MINITCGLTAKKPGSDPCPVFIIQYVTTLLLVNSVRKGFVSWHLCCGLLLVCRGFEAIEWERMIADTRRHIQPVADGEQGPLVLVEGTMVLNYRFVIIYIIVIVHVEFMFKTLVPGLELWRGSLLSIKYFQPLLQNYFQTLLSPRVLNEDIL